MTVAKLFNFSVLFLLLLACAGAAYQEKMSLVASINKTLLAYPQTTLVHIWDGTSSWMPT
jgi:hypothetical protein